MLSQQSLYSACLQMYLLYLYTGNTVLQCKAHINVHCHRSVYNAILCYAFTDFQSTSFLAIPLTKIPFFCPYPFSLSLAFLGLCAWPFILHDMSISIYTFISGVWYNQMHNSLISLNHVLLLFLSWTCLSISKKLIWLLLIFFLCCLSVVVS